MVMISHKHEFIFVKTRKTAGTSVEMALEPLCRPPGAMVVEATPMLKTDDGIVGRRLLPRPVLTRIRRMLGLANWVNHMPASEIRKALGEDRWQRYRKITSVRNPFEVAVSKFNYQEMRAGLTQDDDVSAVRARFAGWVKRTRLDCDKAMVHVDGRFVADIVVRFESLAADVERVYRMFDPATTRVTLHHTKNTAHRRKLAVADYFTAEGIEKVRRDSAWVFERFGYPERPEPARRTGPGAAAGIIA